MPKYRPKYIAARLLRRHLPECLALRVLSNRQIPVETVYRAATCTYSEAMYHEGEGDVLKAVEGATVLEAGTGVYNPASAPLLLCGVDRLILLEPFFGKDIDVPRFQGRFGRLLELAEEDRAFRLPRRVKAESIVDGREEIPPNVSLVPQLWERTGLPASSVDYIFSTSVLEHLRDPGAVLDECHRILKPGGWMINIVDMRDHFFRYPYEMLKYSQRTWQWLTTSSGGAGYQNRWRQNQWVQALDERGFETRVMPLETLDELLALEKPHFAPEYRNLPDRDLRVVRAVFVSQRPA